MSYEKIDEFCDGFILREMTSAFCMICVLDYLVDTVIDAQEPEIHEVVGVELCAV
jgi:hypothetical protein